MPISFIEDLHVKELAPVKLLLFLQAAGDMALYPFFTLHMKSLGITLTEIGIQFAVTPVATLIATPLVGLLADRMGNFRKMLAATLILCAIMANFILLIPKIQHISQCALNNEEITINCPQPADLLEVGNGTTSYNDNDGQLSMTIPGCFERITVPPVGRLLDQNVSSNHSIEQKTQPMNFITLTDCYVDCFPRISSRVRKYCVRETFGKKSIEIPTYDYDELCFSFGTDANGKETSVKATNRFTLGISAPSQHIDRVGSNLTNSSSPINAHLHDVIFEYKFYQKLVCKTSECQIRCPIKETTRISANHGQNLIVDPASRSKTFWMYLLLRISLIVVIATEMSLLKAAILTIVDAHDTEYGFQRLWSSIAVCIVPPITGMVMDRLKANGDPDAFYPCFYVYSGFKVFMACVALVVDLDGKPPSLKIWKKLAELVRNKEVGTLLVFVTIIGTTWGFIETFIIWYLQELHASRTLMGFCFTVAALSGIPFTIGAGYLERRFGHVPILIVGLAAYAVRLLGYSFATNAYHILGLELLEGITTSLVVVTITTYSTILSTHELVATMQATWAALHFAVGRALGSATGGYLMEWIGPSRTYRTFAVMCTVSAVVYLTIYIKGGLRSNELERRRQLRKASNADHKEGSFGSRKGSLTLAGDLESSTTVVMRRHDVPMIGTLVLKSNPLVKTNNNDTKIGVDNIGVDKNE